jgi:hypothetical protein|tara:strand:- start:1315 stop:1962 length:648 start_codon:yes stop_codon:yes gene_type:complete
MTPLWTENISILYEKKYLFEIVPMKNFDLNRKLNSLFRLSIFYSIIVYLVNKNTKSLMIPIGVALFTVIISKNLKKNKMDENIIKLQNDGFRDGFIMEEISDGCRIPDNNNPFMNPTIYSPGDNSKKPCLSYNNKGIQKDIEERFNKDLYKDVNDIFGKNNSQRQFYTVPGKTNPNDLESFKNWLYSTPPTCKEGNGLQCAANGYGTPGGNGGSP